MLSKSTSEEIAISNALRVLAIFKNSLHKPLRLTDVEGRNTLSHQAIFRKIKILESNGILIRNGNYYKPNFENPLVYKILELLSTKESEEFLRRYPRLKEPFDQLISFASKRPELRYIVLFGSYATGKASKKSDIDLFVVIEESGIKRIKENLESLFNQLEGGYLFHRYGFAPVFATPNDVKEMVDDRKKFIQSVIEDGIIIYGDDNYYKHMSSLMKEWSVWK